ncbi:uncharacterized protein LOC110842989 [Folsomia candida]|uniref:uncharacterized protein LOC110842989 n=1 Tax=Folsomia candida TaxID=158441 RepID=UPI000B9070E1|nr:uncharacterized protein LOC110842989 [Folsomia candida]XP_021944580.1 uncharacterized protein LOC110842989 [Folsomia candida]XP_035704336.1 uncharacterized protein LOC110842989 [Folsomia candida]
MADIPTLLNRVMQLEYKLKAMAQRTKKEIIWKKQLEDWILKTFNYDLRLDVELKLLQNEGGSSEFQSVEMNNSQNRVFMGQTSITKTSRTAPSSLSSSSMPVHNPVNNRNFVPQQPQTISSSRQVPPNVSITTMPMPVPSLPVHSSQHVQQTSMMGQLGYHQQRGPPWPGVRQMRPVQLQKRRRIANNVGIRQRAVHHSDMSTTPIIVSTSSMAPAHNRSPELIFLDDDDDVAKSDVTTITSSNLPAGLARTATTFTGTISNISRSGINTSASSNNTSFSNIIPCTSSANTNKTSTAQSSGIYNVNNNTTHGIASSDSPGFSNFVNTSGNSLTGNSVATTNIDTTTNSVSSSSSNIMGIQSQSHLGSSIESILSAAHNSRAIYSGDSIGGGDSENSCGFDSSLLMNMIQLESQHAANNYITRNDGLLMFNIKKILLDYEPNLHNELLKVAPNGGDLPLCYKKKINTNVCHFLIQVYGERVPRVAKEAMADSICSEYPVNKDEWFQKLTNKNATGLIENGLISLRKNLRDHLKRLEQDPSLKLV